MKEIKNNEIYSIQLYDKQDYFDDYDDISLKIAKILSSHNTQATDYNDIKELKNHLEELTDEMAYCDFLDVRIYILTHNLEEKPLSFALLSHDEQRPDWHIELICTNAEYMGEGLAYYLLKSLAEDISKTEFKQLSSIVNKNNEASIGLHRSFEKFCKKRCYEEWLDNKRIVFEYDLTNLAENVNNFENNFEK